MKKSTAVTLVLSGSLLAGCDNSPSDQSTANNGAVLTNNTYTAGYGYWHAPYHGWFPYPYNYYRPGLGYFYGGRWAMTPEIGGITASAPLSGSSVGRSSFSSGSSSFHSSGSTSRGGFGSSGSSSS